MVILVLMTEERAEGSMGNPFNIYNTTDGYEAIHGVRIRAPEKVHNRQKRGTDEDSDSSGGPQGQARPCQP